MISITSSTDLRAVAARMRVGAAHINDELVDELKQVGQETAQYIAENKIYGGSLHYRDGKMAGAVYSRVEGESLSAKLEVSGDKTKCSFIGVQDKGGVIRSSSGHALTVPLAAAKLMSGAPAFTAAEVIADPLVHGYKTTFTHNRVIMGVPASGKGSQNFVPLFALKDSVTIKPAGFFSAAFHERIDRIRERVHVRVLAAAKRVFS